MDNVENKDVRPVRLRQPDRARVEMIVQCPDDLIPQNHPARVIWEVCESQDLSEFYLVKEEIEQAAAEGVTMYVPPKPLARPEPVRLLNRTLTG